MDAICLEMRPNFRGGAFDQTSRSGLRSHKAEMPVVELPDFARPLQLTKAIKWKRQIPILKAAGLIVYSAAVCSRQRLHINSVRDFTIGVIAAHETVIKRLLRWCM